MKTKIKQIFLITLLLFFSCKEEVGLKDSFYINSQTAQDQDGTSKIDQNHPRVRQLVREFKVLSYYDGSQLGIKHMEDNPPGKTIEATLEVINPIDRKIRVITGITRNLKGILDGAKGNLTSSKNGIRMDLSNITSQNPIIAFFYDLILVDVRYMDSVFLNGFIPVEQENQEGIDLHGDEIREKRKNILDKLKALKEYFFEDIPNNYKRRRLIRLLNRDGIFDSLSKEFEGEDKVDLDFLIFFGGPFKQIIDDLILMYESLVSGNLDEARSYLDNFLIHLETKVDAIMGEGFFKEKLLSSLKGHPALRERIMPTIAHDFLTILKIDQYLSVLSPYQDCLIEDLTLFNPGMVEGGKLKPEEVRSEIWEKDNKRGSFWGILQLFFEEMHNI